MIYALLVLYLMVGLGFVIGRRISGAHMGEALLSALLWPLVAGLWLGQQET